MNRERRQRELADRARLDARALAASTFAALISEGRAEMRDVEDADDPGTFLEIRPRDGSAAPVELAIDGVVLSVAVGRDLRVVEIALADPAWRETLQAVLEAVAAGKYTERVERRRLGRVLVMRFDSDRGPIEVKHVNLAEPIPDDVPIQSYTPY